MGIGSRLRKAVKSAGKTTLNVVKKGAPILGGLALGGLPGAAIGGMLAGKFGGRGRVGGMYGGGGGGGGQPKEPRQQMPQFSRNWADPTKNMYNSPQGGMMQGFNGGWNSQFGGERSVAPQMPQQPQPNIGHMGMGMGNMMGGMANMDMQQMKKPNLRFQQPQPKQQHASMSIDPMQYARPEQIPENMLTAMNVSDGMMRGMRNNFYRPNPRQQQGQPQPQQQTQITPQMMAALRKIHF